MKKYILISFMITLLVLAAAPSYAKEGFYVGGNIGIGLMRDCDIKALGFNVGKVDFDRGYILGAAVGYAFPLARLEGEISYQKNDIDKITLIGLPPETVSGDISNLAFLLNAYYDFKIDTAFTPYIGAGIGFARVKGSIEGESQSDTVFAYQIGAGVGIAVTPQVTLDLKYRYYGTQDPGYTLDFIPVKIDNRSHQIFLGLRYAF